MTGIPRTLKLIVQRVQTGSLRHTVGHVEIGGDATSSGGTALTVDVGLVRQARLAEMYVVVDDAWQHVAARGINDFNIVSIGGTGCMIVVVDPIRSLSPRCNLRNRTVGNDDATFLRTSFVDDATALDECYHSFGVFVSGEGIFVAIVSRGICCCVSTGVTGSLRPFMRRSFS